MLTLEENSLITSTTQLRKTQLQYDEIVPRYIQGVTKQAMRPMNML